MKADFLRKKIVVVDDDPGVQEIFKIIFEKAGYDTVVLPQPRPLLEDKHQDADIYLLDKQLSGVDGLTICKYLKQNALTCDKPVFMVSATPNLDIAAAEAGADGFIEKPFLKKDLLAKIEESLRNHNV